MKQRIFFFIGMIAVFVLLGAGCGQKVAERASESAAERAIEKSTNGDVDVDLGTNSLKVNTNGGSYQYGGNVMLPSGFPDDVYVIDGTLTSASKTTENAGYTVSIETTQSVAAAQALYDEKLKSEGWEISLSMTYENSASVGAQKGDRSTTVSIMKNSDNDKTLVVLTTMTNENTNQ